VPLFDLAAAVDDKGHFLAVLRRLHSSSFGGRFDVSDLRITRGYKLGDKLLLGQGMGGGQDACHYQTAKNHLRELSH
jgi:hypothetical protein